MSEMKEMNSAPHTTRPGMQMGLTVVLGLLGTWLMPVRSGFIPNVSAGHHRVALLLWLIALIAGAILLHRDKRIPIPRRLLVYMGLTLPIALAELPSAGMYDLFNSLSLAKISAIALLVLMAGLSPSGPQIRTAIRGIALAVASPLLLFASRPQNGGWFAALARAGFFLFLCALASPLLSLGRDHCPRFVWDLVNVDNMILMGRSFSQWVWLGCASLYVLTPWPGILQTPDPARLAKSNRIGFLSVLGLATCALALLAMLKWRIFLAALSYCLLLVYMNWHAFILLLIATPSRYSLRLPKLRELEPKARMGALGTVLFLSLALVPLAMWCRPAIRMLVTGKLFAARFDFSWVGWTLDQSTIHCGFWRFAMLGVMMAAYVAAARWLCNRSSRLGYWAFALPTAGLCLCLLCYLTCVFYSLAIYIHTMGMTLLRMYGLAYGVGCYILTALFLRWALQRPDIESANVERIHTDA